MQFYDKIYPTILQDTLQDFRSSELFCDVILVVEGNEFLAHKLILSAASSYFRIMFNTQSSFIEARQEKVSLQGIDAVALSDILKFIYCSRIDINNDNVYSLMEAANFLQINALKTFISFYLHNSLNIDNCLQLYLMASLHHYYDLASNALHFILINFSNVVEKEEFLDITFDIMLKLVSSKLLDVPNEETLLQIILKWIAGDVNSRAHHLEHLLSKVDFNLLSVECLVNVKNNSLIQAKFLPNIERIIEQKLSRASITNVIDSEKKYNFHKFRHKSEKAMIFAIGGESSGMASQGVECFTSGFDKWKYIIPSHIIKGQETKYANVLPPLRCARYYAASAYDAYKVFVLGGRNSTSLLDECEVFHIRTNQWNYILKLPEKLYASSAALLEGELIIVGGCNENGISDQVWKLSTVHNMWELMPSLAFSRYFHSAVAIGGYLYVLGGYDSPSHMALKSCLRFDLSSNKWCSISSMHEARAKFGCAVVDNFIYVFGGTSNDSDCLKSVEKYNIFTDEWTHESSMTIARHSFAVAVSDNEIYCIGGSDCTHFLDAVEKFSLRSKRWHYVHSMQISRFAPAAAALLVPFTV